MGRRVQVILTDKNEEELRNRNRKKGDISNIINKAIEEYLAKEKNQQ